MKRYILIFLFVLANTLIFAQRQGGVPQPLPTSTLYTKIVDVHRLYFTVFYNNPIMPGPATQHTFNRPSMLLNDNPIPIADLNSHSLADIDRIEYITASEMKATNDVVVQSLYAGSLNGVIMIYTKAFINSSPTSLRSGGPAYMGYPNLVKRAYTAP